MNTMKKLSKEDLSELKKFSKVSQYNEYNSNIVTMVMWDHVYEVFHEIHEHFALILVNYHHRFGWLMPLCEEKYLEDAFKAMETYSKSHHIAYEIHGMNQKLKDFCENHSLDFVYHNDVDAQDYIYDIEMQKTLSGKKMQKRRNHFNAFIKEYGDRFEYRPLYKEDKEKVFDFLNVWKNEHKDPTSIEREMIGISRLFDLFDELELMGGSIYIDNELKAFSICSELSDNMLQMHVEKADHKIRGLYVAILKYTLMHVDSKYVYLNREDDLGIESLRKAKSDLHPIYKIKKYIAYQGKTMIRKATANDLDQIKKLWMDSFTEEDETSTDYFFNYLYHPEDTYVLLHESKLICMMQTRKLILHKDSQEQPTILIAGVATNPYYKGCGYMNRLMKHVLHSLDVPFVCIQAYNWELYRRFGFSEAYTAIKSHYVKEGLFNGYICHDSAHLLSLYEKYVQNKDGWRVRNLHYYETYFLSYYSDEYEILANEEAYLVVDMQNRCAVECIYTNLDALKSLLNYYEEIDVLSDYDFGNGQIQNVMMVRGNFKRNDFLFISEWQ